MLPAPEGSLLTTGVLGEVGPNGGAARLLLPEPEEGHFFVPEDDPAEGLPPLPEDFSAATFLPVAFLDSDGDGLFSAGDTVVGSSPGWMLGYARGTIPDPLARPDVAGLVPGWNVLFMSLAEAGWPTFHPLEDGLELLLDRRPQHELTVHFRLRWRGDVGQPVAGTFRLAAILEGGRPGRNTIVARAEVDPRPGETTAAELPLPDLRQPPFVRLLPQGFPIGPRLSFVLFLDGNDDGAWQQGEPCFAHSRSLGDLYVRSPMLINLLAGWPAQEGHNLVDDALPAPDDNVLLKVLPPETPVELNPEPGGCGEGPVAALTVQVRAGDELDVPPGQLWAGLVWMPISEDQQ
ncbi:MAG: hypothetical protein FJ125_09880, partial [Deltaproteobacteria bacterium]|nr:hypothetical protein [Deltaproteobacteria bacterium]